MTMKLTKSSIDAAKPPSEPGKRLFLWDSALPGFGVLVLPSGVRTFIFQYRTAEGNTRRYTIGKLSDALTCEQARKIAKCKAVDVHTGIDPMSEKTARRNAITINELFDRYLASPTFDRKAATTKPVDRGRIDRHLRPLLGSQIADQLTADAVRQAQTDIAEGKTAGTFKSGLRGLARVRGGKGTASQAVLILRAAYRWAVSEGILKDNPAGTVKVEAAGQRNTIMGGSADYGKLFTALTTMEAEFQIRKPVADAIRLIALTGARRGEVAGLRWGYVDLAVGMISIPPAAHKAGSRTGKARVITLPAEARVILARQPAGEPTDYVFSPAKGTGPIELAHAWQKVRTKAGLPDNLGLHGLRHSLASHLAMDGASSAELMEVLGHRQASTTQRYIHFAEQARSTLADRAAATAMAGLVSVEGNLK